MTNVDDPSRPEGHPLIEDLVAFVDGDLDGAEIEIVAAHLARCASCSDLVREIEPIGSGDPGLFDGYDFRPTPRLAVPDEPQPGDVWQLDSDEDALLALVLDRNDEGFVVGAVSRERSTGPGHCFSLAVEDDFALFLWNVVATVPLGVFDFPVSHLSESTFESAREWAGTSDEALSGTRDLELGVFERGVSRIDQLLRADLAAALSGVAAADWIPETRQELRPLRDLFAERNLRPGVVAEMSGLSAPAITELLRGRRQATDDEVQSLAALLDVRPDDLRQRPMLPAELVQAVQRPSLRNVIRGHAAARQMSEADARLDVVNSVFALAARTTSRGRDIETWSQLIRHHLDA